MGGDRQSTWEHMAPNKQQAMCSTHRGIWWPAWAHQQDRDRIAIKKNITKITKIRRSQTMQAYHMKWDTACLDVKIGFANVAKMQKPCQNKQKMANII